MGNPDKSSLRSCVDTSVLRDDSTVLEVEDAETLVDDDGDIHSSDEFCAGSKGKYRRRIAFGVSESSSASISAPFTTSKSSAGPVGVEIGFPRGFGKGFSGTRL